MALFLAWSEEHVLRVAPPSLLSRLKQGRRERREYRRAVQCLAGLRHVALSEVEFGSYGLGNAELDKSELIRLPAEPRRIGRAALPLWARGTERPPCVTRWPGSASSPTWPPS